MVVSVSLIFCGYRSSYLFGSQAADQPALERVENQIKVRKVVEQESKQRQENDEYDSLHKNR
jgi:hypothetical protein